MKRQSQDQDGYAREFLPGNFEPSEHFYPHALNSTIHPVVEDFFRLKYTDIAARYVSRNGGSSSVLESLLAYSPKFFSWSGCDLIRAQNLHRQKNFYLIETNSCPSGQKALPKRNAVSSHRGYRELIERTLLPLLAKHTKRDGVVCVLYDKNPMENSGYAQTIADVLNEPVYLAEFSDGENNSMARFDSDGTLQIRIRGQSWINVCAAIRYVTQRPWNRIPANTKTLFINPINACLAGGRNKITADIAYEIFNEQMKNYGVEIRTPRSFHGLSRAEITSWMEAQNGLGVIKNPYTNAGQGVWTIATPDELRDFFSQNHPYEKFLAQELISSPDWKENPSSSLVHTGTLPDPHGQRYAYDLRVMIAAEPAGFYPVALYARRAHKPLITTPDQFTSSWDILGTNLSRKTSDGNWTTEPDRLIPLDEKSFPLLDLTIDDIIEAYVQTVMATVAIDLFSVQITDDHGNIDKERLRDVDDDNAFLKEIL